MKQSNLEYAKGITGETESAPAQNDPQRSNGAGWCGGWEPRTSLPVKPRKIWFCKHSNGESGGIHYYPVEFLGFQKLFQIPDNRALKIKTAGDLSRGGI
jgi:hypothetical protein